MDRSLWLLLRLRYVGAVRRWFRNIRSVKGALLAVLGSSIFLPMILASFVNRQAGVATHVEAIRQYGPLAMLAYCLLNILLSTGEHALFYSPAEVGFLFCGPYRPRQLVLYKVATGLAGTLLTATFLTFAFAQHTPRLLSGFVGLSLGLQFLSLFSLAFGLAANLAGTLASARARKATAAVLVAVACLALWKRGAAALGDDPWGALESALDSPYVDALLAPFRPAVHAFTAREVWPELAVWSSLALGIDLALLALVVRLDAQFYESSAAASERIYEQIRRKRRGQAAQARPSSVRWRLPMAPWWGGAGPNLWRQATILLRTPGRLVGLAAMLVVGPLIMVAMLPRRDGGPPVAVAGLSMMFSLAMVAPSLIGFDFRTDLDRMETLKTLPIAASRLALGQILTPALAISAAEWVTLAALAAQSPSVAAWLAGLAMLLPPLNVLLVAIENLYFLWFPFRMTAANTVDFQAMGRQFLLFTAKFLSAGVAAGLSAGLGAAAYFAAGRSWPAAFLGAWLGLAACALLTLPLVADAFERFDLAEIPDE